MYNYGQLQVDLRRRLGRLVRGGLGPDDERGGLLREGRDRPERLRVHRQGPEREHGRAAPTTSTATRRPTACACTTRRSTPSDEFVTAGRVHQHRGRARPPGALRARAGLSPARHPRGPGPVRPHGRRGEQPAHRPRRRRERPHGTGRRAVALRRMRSLRYLRLLAGRLPSLARPAAARRAGFGCQLPQRRRARRRASTRR